MSIRNASRILALVLLAFMGLWALSQAGGPAAESVARQSAVGALAPAPLAPDAFAEAVVVDNGPVRPVVVDLRTIPPGLYDRDNQLDRWRRGEIDLDESDGLRSAAELAALRKLALELAPDADIQQAPAGPSLSAPTAGVGFDSLDYTECCGGGGNVPPDPELAVGPNHVIAVVNVAFEIYDKTGVTRKAPTTFASFMAANPNCRGVFDPNAIYDESADRFILGIDADGDHYCLAVSQTGDPTGSWYLYAFPTGSDFFDYPHAGVGDDAIYMGANMFRCRGPFGCQFREGRIWAFDKAAMYAGLSASSVSRGLPNSEDTPQPLHLHGFAQGTWPTGGPHYFFTDTNFNGATYSVWSWTDPFGANTLSQVGTVDLVAATGVAAGMPVNVPQSGGQTLQANDFRPQDFEYRNGYAWSVQTIACNPGGGTVNCIRWAQIDPAAATVVDAGVYASSGQYRFFGDLAVNACDDMAVGYTRSSSSMYPSVYYTGRQSTDAAGTLQAEAQLKAGEIVYTSFETSAPRRWGDYTGMTIAPDGVTFWYLGEYSKNTGTSNGRWGTYIGAFSYACNPNNQDNPPSVTVTNPSNNSTVVGTINVTATASDDYGVTQVEFFVDGASIGVDTTAPYSLSWDSTTVADGAHTISATATDTIDQTATDSVDVTVDNVADPTMHVGDLDGSGTFTGRGGRWNATVTVTVHDSSEALVANATVNGSWSNGVNGSGSCTTNSNGQCSITKNNVKSNQSSVTFTVTGVDHTSLTYAAGDNHDPDPDGDSDGTAIDVLQP